MRNDSWVKSPGESDDQYILRMAEARELKLLTWETMSSILNSQFGENLSIRSWRRRIEDVKSKEDKDTVAANEDVELDFSNFSNFSDEEDVISRIKEEAENAEAERYRLREERRALKKLKREGLRESSILELFADKITSAAVPSHRGSINTPSKNNSLYVLLSDVHYGMSFKNRYGSYSPEIADERLKVYAASIVSTLKEKKIDTVYISLLGDMISGGNHQCIQIENQEDIVDQVMGVSESVAQFIYDIAEQAKRIYINSVGGNHSRVEKSLADALVGERLDRLVFWYCKKIFANDKNITFVDDNLDPTICKFKICGKNYIGVHGDLDKDLKTVARKYTEQFNEPVAAVVSAHLHVAEARYEDIAYIKNGSVIGSGDNYTVSKRLYCGPTQVTLICDENGIKEYLPIKL